MGQFHVPPQVPKKRMVIDYFRGVDLNNSPANVDPSRSPAAPNMVRDQVGKVRKRMGYRRVARVPGNRKVNGVHRLKAETLIHAGTVLYKWDLKTSLVELKAGMSDQRSASFVYDEKLYILDGGTYWVYDGTDVKPVSETAYVPTIIISRTPSGGGTAYEALNLIGTAWKESFLSDGSATKYQLTTKDLDPTPPMTAEILNEAGEWVAKKEGTDFTVDRTKGVVTFNSAPGKPPVTGQDNVRITAYKTREGYADKVNHCSIFATYGVGGAPNRVFLSGNEALPGQDFYSGYDDPTFFPDTNYTKLSRDGSQVAGYAILNNNLATFLRGTTDGRNVIVRQGSLDSKGEAVFRITNTLLGEDPVAPDTFVVSGKEPLFLTEQGVYAITAEELTGEKYSQERSFYIKSALKEIAEPEKCYATKYGDFYVLSTGSEIYLLDLQQKSYEKNAPYSSYQYEAYYWPSIAAEVLWVQENGALCFGDDQGGIYRFHTDVDDPTSYEDEGKPIEAYWETTTFDGDSFYKSKTFTLIGFRLASGIQTGAKVFAEKNGIWQKIYDAQYRALYLDFNFIDFSKFTFRTDPTPKTLTGKIKLKKLDKTRLRFENREKDEPFGLYAIAIEWREPGNNYKR